MFSKTIFPTNLFAFFFSFPSFLLSISLLLILSLFCLFFYSIQYYFISSSFFYYFFCYPHLLDLFISPFFLLSFLSLYTSHQISLIFCIYIFPSLPNFAIFFSSPLYVLILSVIPSTSPFSPFPLLLFFPFSSPLPRPLSAPPCSAW